MKRNGYLFFILFLGLVGCSMQNSVFITPTTSELTVSFASGVSEPTVISTPTYDHWCWKKEKECEIAKNLGVDIQQIASFSPDMQWAVLHNLTVPITTTEQIVGGMRFIKVDTSKEWTFDTTQMREDIGECKYFLKTNFWSSDSRYVYFSPDPSYCSRLRNFSDVGTQVLYQLNVETGELIEYLPFDKNHNSTTSRDLDLYTLAFSPDGKYLAYVQTLTNPLVVHVRNLITDVEATYAIDSKYSEGGCLTWSFRNNLLFFYGATTTSPEEPLVASFYKINIEHQVIKEIVLDQSYLYCMSNDGALDDGDFVFTKKVDTSSGDNENIYFDPYAEIFRVFPTSTPYPSETSHP